MIKSGDIVRVLEDVELSNVDIVFSGLGVASSNDGKDLLSFVTDKKYINEVNENDCITGLFVKREHAEFIHERICTIIVDDPIWSFFTLVNHNASLVCKKPTVISMSAQVAESAVIAPYGVVIGENVIIEPNVVVMEDVYIGGGSTVRAGAVLGTDGFEHKRTSKGVLSVKHDGKLIIGENVEIGPLNTIIKGFSYRDTILGDETKLDANIHYAHGVQCGKRCFIAASAMIAGHVTMGDDVWVGPSATISNRVVLENSAFVTIGSVVVKNVKTDEKVTGNFAIPHVKFIKALKAKVK